MQSASMRSLYDCERHDLEEFCRERGVPRYRAAQLWDWLYRRRVAGWEQMGNLPMELRKELALAWRLHAVALDKTDGGAESDSTRKILVRLHDGESVESVLIPAPGRRTVCVSTQVGCRYNCAFCASGKSGFTRDLEVSEMVGPGHIGRRRVPGGPTHVVYMGIGEPLDNYDRVLKSVRIINDADGLNIGARRITISTSGIVPGIDRLASEGLQVELSVSLHAPDEQLRSRLMPVSRRYPLADLMDACRRYAEHTGRLITFEYTLIRGVNDGEVQARALVRLLKPVRARINLIPLSPVSEFDGQAASEEGTARFAAVLRGAHINVTARISKGSGIHAACGQLRVMHQ